MHSYNLVSENWIPSPQGNLSLYDVFSKAHEVDDIFGDTSIQTSSLYFLLITITQATYRGMDESRWLTLWNTGRFDDRILEYLKKWIDRFELFSESHPFMQDPTLHLFVKKEESVSSLFQNIKSGVDPVYTSTLFISDPIVSAARAARGVITTQYYGLAGTKGPGMAFTDASATRQAVFFVLGKNLFETIMLNTFKYPVDLPSDVFPQTEFDMPVWERAPSEYFDDTGRPLGFLDYMTWLNRRIQLVPMHTPDGLFVKYMYYSIGLNLPKNYLNPYSKYIFKKQKKDDDPLPYYSYKFERDKVLWRDLTALLQVYLDDNEDIAPYNISWLKHLIKKGVIPSDTIRPIGAFGQVTKKGQDKTYDIIGERIPLPLIYLADERLSSKIGDALLYASEVESVLNSSLKLAAALIITPKESDYKVLFGKGPLSNTRDKLLKSWLSQSNFWVRLQPHFYEQLDALTDPTATLEEWRAIVRRVAGKTFDDIVSGADTSTLNKAYYSGKSFLFGKLRERDDKGNEVI